jgi:hypothetical protein
MEKLPGEIQVEKEKFSHMRIGANYQLKQQRVIIAGLNRFNAV